MQVAHAGLTLSVQPALQMATGTMATGTCGVPPRAHLVPLMQPRPGQGLTLHHKIQENEKQRVRIHADRN